MIMLYSSHIIGAQSTMDTNPAARTSLFSIARLCCILSLMAACVSAVETEHRFKTSMAQAEGASESDTQRSAIRRIALEVEDARVQLVEFFSSSGRMPPSSSMAKLTRPLREAREAVGLRALTAFLYDNPKDDPIRVCTFWAILGAKDFAIEDMPELCKILQFEGQGPTYLGSFRRGWMTVRDFRLMVSRKMASAVGIGKDQMRSGPMSAENAVTKPNLWLLAFLEKSSAVVKEEDERKVISQCLNMIKGEDALTPGKDAPGKRK